MKEVNNIINEIKKGNIKPVYFLTGDTDFFIDQISNYIEENLLPEDAKGFDQMVLYGMDVNMRDLVMQAKRFPMIGERIVMIIKEAQHLFKKKDDFDVFEEYMKLPSDKTVIVFNYKHKKPDGRKKVFKLIKEKGVFYQGKKLYERDVVKWIQDTVLGMGYHIDIKSTQMLVEFLGTDLSKIYNEINKLKILIPEKSSITPDVIEKNIGISKEYNNFELKDAIAKNDYLKAQRIINYYNANPKEHAIPAILPNLYTFFKNLFLYHSLVDKSEYSVSKALGIHKFFVRDYEAAARKYPMKKITRIMSYLQEADLKSKGVNSGTMTQKDIMNELIFKVMH